MSVSREDFPPLALETLTTKVLGGDWACGRVPLCGKSTMLSLEARLRNLAIFEQENKLLGIGMLPKQVGDPLLAEDTVDVALAVCQRTVELLARSGEIPVTKPYTQV